MPDDPQRLPPDAVRAVLAAGLDGDALNPLAGDLLDALAAVAVERVRRASQARTLDRAALPTLSTFELDQLAGELESGLALVRLLGRSIEAFALAAMAPTTDA